MFRETREIPISVPFDASSSEFPLFHPDRHKASPPSKAISSATRGIGFAPLKARCPRRELGRRPLLMLMIREREGRKTDAFMANVVASRAALRKWKAAQ